MYGKWNVSISWSRAGFIYIPISHIVYVYNIYILHTPYIYGVMLYNFLF